MLICFTFCKGLFRYFIELYHLNAVKSCNTMYRRLVFSIHRRPGYSCIQRDLQRHQAAAPPISLKRIIAAPNFRCEQTGFRLQMECYKKLIFISCSNCWPLKPSGYLPLSGRYCAAQLKARQSFASPYCDISIKNIWHASVVNKKFSTSV